jgi:hypothetical protein
MANNQIDVTIRANDQTNQGIETAKRQIETFKETQRQALGQHREDVERARGAAELLGAQFGVTIPRELRKVIAESAVMGKALAAAFTVAAAIGFLNIADKIVDKFIELTNAVSGFSDAQTDAMNKAFADSSSLLRLQREQLETIRAQRLSSATSDDERRGLKELFALEDVSAAKNAIAETKRQLEEAEGIANDFSRFSAAEAKNREGGPFSANKILGAFIPGLGAWRDANKFMDDISASTAAHEKAILAATAARNAYNDALASGETAQQGIIKLQDEENKRLDELKTKADAAYRQGLEAAIDRASQASKFLLGNLDEQVKAISALRSEAEKLTPAEQRLRYFEVLFKLNPQDKGLVREGLDFWREKVEGEANHITEMVNASGVNAGKAWVDGFVSEIQKLKEENLPEKVPTLLLPGEKVEGQDKRLLPVGKEQFNEMSAQMKTIKAISQEVGDGFSNIFAEMIDGTHSVSEAFANMAKAVAASIASMIAKMVIMAAVERIIGSIAGAFGWGGGSGASVSSANWNVGQFQFAGARAAGGPVSANMPYLIGERGPELFVPGASGSIVPNGGFGGSNVQVNIINETGSQVRKSESAPQFDGKKWIQTVILEDVSSNGPIGQMLKGRR